MNATTARRFVVVRAVVVVVVDCYLVADDDLFAIIIHSRVINVMWTQTAQGTRIGGGG